MGITLCSTSFDETAVELLEKLENPVYKIASFELTDLPLIKMVAETGKPMIMSTGLANFEEIAEAVNTARINGCNDLVLLHCISGYPTPPEETNLRVIPDLAEKFGVISGLVMERGGILSHASIVAREFRLPTVTNIPNATTKIKNGDILHIDGVNGRLTLVEKSARSADT